MDISTDHTEAFVVHLIDFSETSRVIQFFTAQRGKIACIAKGLKRKNNPWKSALDRFNLLEITYSWRPNRELQVLTEVALIQEYLHIKRNIHKQALASLILESAFHLTGVEQQAKTTFHYVLEFFHRIDSQNEITKTTLAETCVHFWTIIRCNGYEPEVDRCIICNKPVSAPKKFSFHGGIVCDSCPGHMDITPEIHSFLQKLKKNSNTIEEVQNISASSSVLSLLCQYVSFQTHTMLKSYNVYKELFSSKKGFPNENQK